MAVTARYAPRRGHLSYVVILLTVLAGTLAVLPIAAAIFGGVSSVSRGKTAFASAPAGDYLILGRAEDTEDVIVAAPAGGSLPLIEVARVPHLPGFPSTGAASPDGTRLALIVADGGSRSQPVASLVIVDLETGALTRLLGGLDYLQRPLWAPGSDSVVVTTAPDGSAGSFTFVRAYLDGSLTPLAGADGVAGAFPVAFDSNGRFVAVVIDATGSVVLRDGAMVTRISSFITRDWQLSPDGSRIAFIETNTSGGLHYTARVANLDGSADATGQLVASTGQQLGVAWAPAGIPAFGAEPGGGVSAQGGEGGFDIPLAYTANGRAFAVEHWTGSSFSAPGKMTIEVLVDGSRQRVDGYTEFYGWVAR
ncbi:MAG: hypothetical protein HY875_00595 [Chloroflexi bacterium]|nr:hypothetical protein [Chloroflexota bacterium]